MTRQKTKSNSRRQQVRSEQTRSAILRAAEQAFAKLGLAGARTDKIAAAAGVNKAMLYYYFSSKEKLYEAVIEDLFSEFNRRSLEILTAPGSPRAILLKYVAAHFDFISMHHRYATLFQHFMMAGGTRLKRMVQKYFLPRSKALDKLLHRGMKAGDFRRGQRFHTAISIVALIVFYFSAAPMLQMLGHSDAYSKTNLRRRRHEVLQFIRHALFTEPEAQLT